MDKILGKNSDLGSLEGQIAGKDIDLRSLWIPHIGCWFS